MQLRPQLAKFYRTIPYYVAEEGFYERTPRVYMGQTEMNALVPQSPHSVRAISDLRSVSSYDDVKETASFFLVIWWMT